jgi:hypothetical protein
VVFVSRLGAVGFPAARVSVQELAFFPVLCRLCPSRSGFLRSTRQSLFLLAGFLVASGFNPLEQGVACFSPCAKACVAGTQFAHRFRSGSTCSVFGSRSLVLVPRLCVRFLCAGARFSFCIFDLPADPAPTDQIPYTGAIREQLSFILRH